MTEGKARTRRILFAVAIVTFFIYTLWSTITWMKDRRDPQWTEERKKEFMANSVAASIVLSSIDPKISNEIATCYTDKIAAKYTYSEILAMDAVLQKGDSSDMKDIELIMQSCMGTHIEEIERQRAIIQCEERIKENGIISEEMAAVYCDCFVPYLHDKYGTLQLSDSIFRSEQAKARDCLGVVPDSGAFNSIHH